MTVECIVRLLVSLSTFIARNYSARSQQCLVAIGERSASVACLESGTQSIPKQEIEADHDQRKRQHHVHIDSQRAADKVPRGKENADAEHNQGVAVGIPLATLEIGRAHV